VIRNVFRRDEIYSGPVAGAGPDLVALSHHGFDLKGSLHAADVFSRSGLQGMHTWDDALALTGAELPQPLLIWDVTEAVLNGIGIR
jgi:predicted AlkP superfamily phosphohydrolase/phosphomutase